MTPARTKKTIGFIELPDEALDLFGQYALRPDWEVALVVNIDGQSYAARMAQILRVPLLDRPNRPALVVCDRLIVGKKPGLRAMVQELLDGTPVEVIPVEDALRDLGAGGTRGGHPASKTVETPEPKSAPVASTPVRPTPPPRGRATKPAAPGELPPASRPSFDAGTILGADFRTKLRALRLDNADQLLREILELAVKVMRADSGSIMLVDESGSHLRIAVADGLPEWVIAHTRQEVGKGISGTVFASGEPRLLHGHMTGPEMTSPDVRPGLRDAACVAIPGKDGPIGVLNLNVESDDTQFDSRTLELLKLFAREASSAILRAISLKRLTGTMQREVAMRQVERLMSLRESLASRLQSVADVLGQTLGSDYTHCLVADASGENLELVGPAKGLGLLTTRKQPADRGFAGWVLRQGTPCVLEAGPSEDRAALAYLPLTGGRPYGLFFFERIPLLRASAVQVLQVLTEAKEIIEALLALEEATEDPDSEFPPRRASA